MSRKKIGLILYKSIIFLLLSCITKKWSDGVVERWSIGKDSNTPVLHRSMAPVSITPGLTNMKQLEIEVKFYLRDIESMQRRILALGAQSKGRMFESNFRYEDENSNLIKKK